VCLDRILRTHVAIDPRSARTILSNLHYA
jgi:hypothetical protein